MEEYNISEETLRNIRLEGSKASWSYSEEKVKLP